MVDRARAGNRDPSQNTNVNLAATLTLSGYQCFKFRKVMMGRGHVNKTRKRHKWPTFREVSDNKVNVRESA
jgi:hypothetical protein